MFDYFSIFNVSYIGYFRAYNIAIVQKKVVKKMIFSGMRKSTLLKN